MKIGIISDTHNDFGVTQRAVEVFKIQGVDIVIHAGDLTSPGMIDLFKGLNCKFVLGNGDIDVDMMNERSVSLGCGTVQQIYDLKFNDKRIFVMHGNDGRTVKSAIFSGEYDYIIKGHTHFYEDYISNNTRVLNPGSLRDNTDCFVAILDLMEDSVEKIKIDA